MFTHEQDLSWLLQVQPEVAWHCRALSWQSTVVCTASVRAGTSSSTTTTAISPPLPSLSTMTVVLKCCQIASYKVEIIGLNLSLRRYLVGNIFGSRFHGIFGCGSSPCWYSWFLFLWGLRLHLYRIGCSLKYLWPALYFGLLYTCCWLSLNLVGFVLK